MTNTTEETKSETKVVEEVTLELSGSMWAALLGARAQKDVRGYLKGIALECTESGGAYLIACDGHALVVAEVVAEVGLELGAERVALAGWLAGRVAIFAPAPGVNFGKGGVYARVRPDTGGPHGVSVELQARSGTHAGLWWPANMVGGKYPEWRRVDAWQGPDAGWQLGTGEGGFDVSIMHRIWPAIWALSHHPDKPGVLRCTVGRNPKGDAPPNIRVTLMGCRM